MSRTSRERFRRSTPPFVVALAALFAVGGAFAANINGTPKNDTLRGSAKADKIYGKGGNDKLFGLGGADYLNGGPGNDVLTGGPGADVLACGPGRDTAAADAADKVGADCEILTGLPKQALSIVSSTMSEGNDGTRMMQIPVMLARARSLRVAVSYATQDATATAASDYTATSGTLTFDPGVTIRTIAVPIVGDTAHESDETFSVTLSNPMNAVLGQSRATATITNDDVAVQLTPGAYKGATQEGNFVFFTVLPNRMITGFRINDLVNNCNGGLRIPGGVDWSSSTFSVGDDGNFQAEGSWNGSQASGDVEWTAWSAKVTGRFDTATSVTGTVIENNELNYRGTHYVCSSGQKAWSAKLQ